MMDTIPVWLTEEIQTAQKSAGGRPLPKSRRQELGIFHCEEGSGISLSGEASVEEFLCNKDRVTLWSFKE